MTETIDQQFIDYIVKALVGNPDKVRVERKIDERGVLLELYVDAEDLGRVIGRNGTTAKSIRTLLRALGIKNDARYNLKIVDTNGGPRPVRSEGQPGEPVAAPTTQASASPSDQTVDMPVPASDQPSEPVAANDAPPASDATPPEETSNPFESLSSEPSEPEPAKEPESDVERHRREIQDLAGDLDI